MFDFDDGLGGGMGGFGGGYGGRKGGRKEKPKPKVPVTILCGFLGAGKTTMVRHILQNREGLKVGVVVNDVAEANIDSEVLAFEDADGIVGLQNGCACCSGRDDLFARLQDLVESDGVSKLDRGWDRLVVECSGVAEPEGIASELEAMTHRGEKVMKRIFLAGIICVVDASTFWESYNEATAQASAAGGAAAPATEGVAERKPLSALLVNQLESSDTVIINKSDLAKPAEMEKTTALLKALCPNARHFTSTKGALPLRTLLPAEPINLDMPAYVPTLENRHGVAVRNAKSSAPPPSASPAEGECTGHGGHGGHGGHSGDGGHGHADGGGHGHGDAAMVGHERGHEGGHEHGKGHAHGHDADREATSHEAYGLTSFVYRRIQFFSAAPLAAVARQLPVAVADVSELDIAEADLAASPAFRGVLRSKGFVRVVGKDAPLYWSHAGRQLQLATAPRNTRSKGQELVFIGIGMDARAIVQALDSCLEQSGEAKDGKP